MKGMWERAERTPASPSSEGEQGPQELRAGAAIGLGFRFEGKALDKTSRKLPAFFRTLGVVAVLRGRGDWLRPASF